MQDKMKVGQIVNTFGVKGEIKVYPDNQFFEQYKELYVNGKKMEVKSVRYQKNLVIMKLQGLDDISEAEKLKGAILEVDKEEIPELPKDVYYINDLIGLNVYSDDGKYLGKLDDIFNTGANDIYKVGEILLPAIKEVIQEIDIENKKIVVHIIKGLID